MAIVVLVHPAWLGGWCWKKLVPLLEERGHTVYTPTLTGLGERSHLAHPGITLQTHVDDVVNVLTYADLRDLILVGTSSSGAVVTGVADRVPERIAQLVYVDAFVPEDGQALWDLIPPQRRPPMKALVDTEGFGWLLPRFGPEPWEQFVRQAWQVTDEADQAWMLARVRPTPFGHFTSPVRLVNPAAERLPKTYIRCPKWPNPSFDRYAQAAGQNPSWHLLQLGERPPALRDSSPPTRGDAPRHRGQLGGWRSLPAPFAEHRSEAGGQERSRAASRPNRSGHWL